MMNYHERRNDDKFGKTSGKEVANAFKRAVENYILSMKKRDGDKYSNTTVEDIWVLMVVEKNERNLGDQRLLE